MLSFCLSLPGLPREGPISFPVHQGRLCLLGGIWQCLRVFWLSRLGKGAPEEGLSAPSGWRLKVLLNISEYSPNPASPALRASRAQGEALVLLCSASQGSPNLRVASSSSAQRQSWPPPRQPQELRPLSRMPFSSGQVAPAEFTAGHAVHQPQLCFKVSGHTQDACLQLAASGGQPPCRGGRESSREADSLRAPLLRPGSEAPGGGLGRALSTCSPLPTHPSVVALPEDGLLNISRNSPAKPVNCFLGNTLNKDGRPPGGRAESLAWTAHGGAAKAWLQARGLLGEGRRARGAL